jgi:glycosyltransferase involved in cell wall biosynthesis
VLHFINTDRFQPDEAERRRCRAQLGVENRFVMLVVGQLIKEKGIDVAVRALAALPDSVVLWIVGRGPEEDSLRRLIADLHLGERARLLGLQRHVQPYLQSADCFVCPSLWAEAAGLVNIEAQACGTPVVASRIGGIPEYVADGKTGLLFPPGDAATLAHCVRRLLEDPVERGNLAANARAHAMANFSVQARMPEWLDLYRRWRE